MHDLYQQGEIEGVHLVNAENALNAINRKAMLHNIFMTDPTISISNCHLVLARLFVIGNKEVKCKDGTTLWGTIAMGAYALGEIPLIHFLHEYILVNK